MVFNYERNSHVSGFVFNNYISHSEQRGVDWIVLDNSTNKSDLNISVT